MIFESIQASEGLSIFEEFTDSYLSKWESRGSIRSRPKKFINFEENGYFFPEEKQPLLLTSKVVALGEEVKQEILLQTFFKYLNDIISLEVKLINSACHAILYADLPVKYPEELKLTTYTILIDEYYHVYLAKDMLLQLSEHFSTLEKLNYPTSDAYNAVILIKERMDDKYKNIFEILAVCIFETTLVRELVEFFNSTGIHPSIKYYVNDHMNDEARHYSFFYNLLCYTWQALPEDYQENIGKNLAIFVKLYLNVNSDKKFNLNLLNSLLKDEEEAIKIIEDLYKGFDITPDIPIVKNVLNVLKKSGVLRNPHVQAGFKEFGWNL